MRESLTVLAAFLVLLFTAALVGPYFIDWSARRAFIEARLSEALGEPVKIRGRIDLKLLPTPYLLMDHVEVADAKAPLGFSADGLQFEIAVAPLLRGQIDFIEARLQKPHLRLTLAADGSLLRPAAPTSLSAQMRFERISVTDGDVTLEDPANGRSLVLGGLTLNAQASSLTGPFKGDGSAALADERVAFRFSTGALEADRLRLKLIVDATTRTPRADVEGAVVLTRAGAKIAAPAFVGTFALGGLWPGPSGAGFAVPWRFSGTVRADVRKASVDKAELRLGTDERAMSFAGKADVDLSASPKAKLSLRARQIDLDRFLTQKNGPPPLQRAASILDALVSDPSLSSPPIPLTLAWSAESAALGGETLTGLSGAMTYDEDKPPQLRFEGNGPGRARLLLDGEVETGSAAGFNGRLEAGVGDLDKVADWLAPAFPNGLPAARPFRTFDATGQVGFSRVGFSGRDLTLRFDRSTLSGTLAFTGAVGKEPPRLFADLTAPALDLDGLPNLASMHAAKSVDLSIRLAARAIKLARIGHGTIDAGKIKLNLTKTGDDVRVTELAVDGLGGANVRATGAWTAKGGNLEAKVDAARLQDLADLLNRLAPMPATAFFVKQAPALSPARLALNVQATPPASESGLRLTGLALDGTVGATRLSAKVGVDPKNIENVDGSMRVDATDATALMRQLGMTVLPFAGMGPGHINITAHGPLSKEVDASLSASLAGLNFGFAGSVAPDLTAPHLTGALKLTSADASPFLHVMALAFPDPATKIPIDLAGSLDWTPAGFSIGEVKGSIAATPIAGSLAGRSDAAGHRHLTGAIQTDKWAFTSFAALALGAPQPAKPGANWSSLPFAVGLVDPPNATIAVKAKRFDLPNGVAGSDATMRLEIAPGVVALHDFACKIGAARATGNLTLRRDGPVAAVEGHVAVTDFALALPSAKGRLTAAFDLAGTGQTPLALISGLGGSGHATIADLVIPHSDPAALETVFAAAEDDQLSVDEAEVTRALRRAFDPKSLVLGTRDFDLGLAAGVLRLAPPKVAKIDTDEASTLSAAFDLRTLTLDERLGLTLQTLPKDWTGEPPHVDINFKGGLADSTPRIDASSFVNALAARAIARESARIQAYEFDIHERAFFNQRLLSERRREQERLNAEEARRAAEVAQRKAEDDARRAAELAQRKAEDDARRAAELAQRKAEDDARRAADLAQRKADDDRRRAEALRLDQLKKAEDARRKAQSAPVTGAAGRPAQISPPAAMQAPAYVGHGPAGAPTDPSAAGRY